MPYIDVCVFATHGHGAGELTKASQDDGFILFESRAIGRYVATKWASSGTPLVPNSSDIKALALFEQAASIETSNFDPGASGITKEKVFKP